MELSEANIGQHVQCTQIARTGIIEKVETYNKFGDTRAVIRLDAPYYGQKHAVYTSDFLQPLDKPYRNPRA